MSNIERKKLALTASPATAYTVPVGKRAVVQNIIAANVDGYGLAVVDVWWTDAEDSEARVDLARQAGIAAGDALTVAERLHLKAGDSLKAQAAASGDAVLTCNILEFAVSA